MLDTFSTPDVVIVSYGNADATSCIVTVSPRLGAACRRRSRRSAGMTLVRFVTVGACHLGEGRTGRRAQQATRELANPTSRTKYVALAKAVQD